jgi:probable rRNA maturation factor
MKKPGPPRVEVHNLQRKIEINVMDLRKFGNKAAALCLQLFSKTRTQLDTLSDVSILIVSDRRMASLHRRFMSRSGATDVITFQHGEIFISADTAVRNARRFGNSLGGELRLYIVHGLLHLHGFEDRNATSATKMRAAEQKLLSKFSNSSAFE